MMHVSQTLISRSISVFTVSALALPLNIFALNILALPTKVMAHGSALTVPDMGLRVELELEQNILTGLPDTSAAQKQYQVFTPVFALAEAPENGFNPIELKLALTSALESGWLVHGALANHSHDGDTQLQVDQAFIQSERTDGHPWQLKLGRFYSDVGFYNAEGHRDLLYPVAPLAYQSMMGEELLDEGIQLSYQLAESTLFGFEVFSGENAIAGQRQKGELTQTQSVYLDQGIDLNSLGHLDLKLAYLHSQQNYQSSESDHSHSNSDLSYRFTGELDQLIVSTRWQLKEWQLAGEIIKRQQDGELTTSDQLLKLDDNSYGFYGLISYSLNPKWQLSGRYDRLVKDVESFGHQDLLTQLAIDTDSTPENISFILNYSPSREQLWSVNIGQYKQQWQDEDTGWYGGLSYRLNFSGELL